MLLNTFFQHLTPVVIIILIFSLLYLKNSVISLAKNPIFNLDYQQYQIINYLRYEQVSVDIGSGSSSIQSAQNLTFYVLDKTLDNHTSMILQINDQIENKSDYFAFTISPNNHVLSFQYSKSIKDTSIKLGRSSIFQFTPSLTQWLFNQDQHIFEKMGDMLVKFHRKLSYNSNNTISISRKLDPQDIINTTSATNNFSFIDISIFNNTNGILLNSHLQQSFLLANQLGQFTYPGGTVNSSKNVDSFFNLTTNVDIIKQTDQIDFVKCQKVLFLFKLQGNLVIETDIQQSQLNNQINQRIFVSSSNSTNTNNTIATKEKRTPNITSLKNISLFQTDLFGCKLSLFFNLQQQQLFNKGRSLYILSLFSRLGNNEKQIMQKRLFSTSPDMTTNNTKSRILNLLGLPQQSSQRKLRNLAKFEVDDVFNMTQLVSPQTDLKIKLIVNTDFIYDLDILNYIDNVENQKVDPVTNKIYNKSVLTQPWRKLENRSFNSSFNINLNIMMQANFNMKVQGGNIVLNTTADLLNTTAQLLLIQQFNFPLNSLKFNYSIAFGKIIITPYLNKKSCIKNYCTEQSIPQRSYILFDGTSLGESRKEEKIKDQEKQEYDVSNEQNEEQDDDNINNKNSTKINENNSTTTSNTINTTLKDQLSFIKDQEEQELISQGGNGQPELKPENEVQNQKKTCDIKDNKCYSYSPCGCQIFPQITKQISCPDYKKGLENGCDLQEPYIDYEFIKCNVKSCNIPNILVSQDTCQAKQDASFKIGMDFEISDIDQNQVKVYANETGIKTTINIINLINYYSQKNGIDDPNIKNVNNFLLSDQETNLINQVQIDRSVKRIQVQFDKFSQEATLNQSKLFNQLPRSIRTVIFYFYFQFTDMQIKSNQFLFQVNEFILLQKWKQAIDLCYQDQLSCSQFNLNQTISLMRFACIMCSKTSQMPAELIFIMDSSGSIQGQDFQKEREFVRSLTQSLMSNNNGIKVGIVQFSSSSIIECYLESNLNIILQKLSNIKQLAQSTNTYLALNDAKKIFQSSKIENVKKILFIITDGQSTDSGQCISSSQDLKKYGINIYSIGIGTNLNYNELQMFATSPENVFLVSNFSILNQIQSSLQKEVCFGTIPFNSSFKVSEIKQKAGTYSYLSFEYNPLDGKTITIEYNKTSIYNKSCSSNSPQSSCIEEISTNYSNQSIKQNQNIQAFYSVNEKYPNQYNNDGFGIITDDGQIKISKEKEGYTSSNDTNQNNTNQQNIKNKNLYVSIITKTDQTIKIIQENYTQQVVPCQINCTTCNAMGNICQFCTNQTFLFNGQCYYKNDTLGLLSQQTSLVNNKENQMIECWPILGIIFSIIYLISCFGYQCFVKSQQDQQVDE